MMFKWIGGTIWQECLLVVFCVFSVLCAEERVVTLVDAVESALRGHPEIHISREQYTVASESVREAEAPFDVIMSASLSRVHSYLPLIESSRISYGVDSTRLDTLGYDIDASKQFHCGATAIAGVGVIKSGGSHSDTTSPNRGTVYFTVDIPLLKGAGTMATTSMLRAAKEERLASGYDMRNVISRTVLDVIGSYWNCIVAEHMLEVRNATEERASKVLEATKGLVKAGEYAEIQITQSQAFLSDAKVMQVAAKKAFLVARRQLALDMGISYSDFGSLPEVVGEFPRYTEDIVTLSVEELIGVALKQRADMHAVLKREEYSSIMYKMVRNNEKPTFDIDVNVGYSSVEEGKAGSKLFTSLKKNIGGPNASATISCQYPLGNRDARAETARYRSMYRQAEIRREEKARNISAEVEDALEALTMAIEKVRNAIESSEAISIVSAAEGKKFSAGISTVFELVTLEDRVTSARVKYEESGKDYAIALATLQYAIGDIVKEDDGRFFFNTGSFVGE